MLHLVRRRPNACEVQALVVHRNCRFAVSSHHSSQRFQSLFTRHIQERLFCVPCLGGCRFASGPLDKIHESRVLSFGCVLEVQDQMILDFKLWSVTEFQRMLKQGAAKGEGVVFAALAADVDVLAALELGDKIP